MDAKGELRPDVFVNNIVPSEGNRLATIRKPHNPLKCPSNSNDENDDIDVSAAMIIFQLARQPHIHFLLDFIGNNLF